MQFKNLISRMLCVVSIIFFASSNVFGIERWWTGNGSNDIWSNPNNWDPVGIPTLSDSLYSSYSDLIKIINGVDAEAKFFRHLGDLTIEIGGTLTIVGGTLEAKGEITNKGTITVSDSPAYGILHSTQQSTNELFLNEGAIYINNAALGGLFVRYDQIFTNKPSGIIEIDGSGNEGLQVQGVFQNLGSLKIRNSSMGKGMIFDPGAGVGPAFLSNDACGKIVVRDKIEIIDGSITNNGFFKQVYDGNNEIGIQQVLNYGFIEDWHYSFDYSDINHFGIWLKELQIVQPNAGQEIQLFDNDFVPPINSNMGDVYVDKDLTILAGTLDFNSGYWIPNSNAANDSIFYIEASNALGTCSDTLRFETELPIQDVNYWIGGTGNWHFGFNWSKGSTPIADEIVGIFDTNAIVSMPPNYTAECKKIFLNGKFTISIGTTFTLQGNFEGNGMELAKGELINNGSIYINNYDFGIVNYGGSVVNNNIIIGSGNQNNFYLINDDSQLAIMDNKDSIFIDSGTLASLNNSVLINSGKIIAQIGSSNYGINGDTIINYGEIHIVGENNTSPGTGISGLLDNYGFVSTINLEKGLNTEGINEGQVEVQNCLEGMSIIGDFENRGNGVINIQNSDTGLSIYSSDFKNSAPARILISNCEEALMNYDDLMNSGEILINNTLYYAIISTSLFENSGGTIEVFNSHGQSLTLLGPTAEFQNTGSASLKINPSLGYGIFIFGGQLVNSINSTIIVFPCGLDQINMQSYNHLGIQYDPTLENSGGILLKK